MRKLNYFKKQDYALITGASSGIGKAFAQKFASLGCYLIIVARSKDRLEELANELEKTYGIKVEILVADLANNQDMSRVEQRISQKDNLAVLVNCAGFALRKSFVEQDLLKQLSMIQVHIVATTRFVKAALPKMVANNRGLIINVSSLLSLMTLNNNVVHCATKSYLNRFSENLQMEVNDKNIKVQALNAGFTITNFHSTEEFKGVKRNYPRMFTMFPDELVSKSLAGLKRGKVIFVPGLANKFLVGLRTIFAGQMRKSMK